MHLHKISFFLMTAVVLIAGCKKENAKPEVADTSPDDCIQKASINNGETIQGRYIVVYKTASVSSRGVTEQRLNSIGSELLVRNKINKSALMQSFGGEPGGFIASLSAGEATRLAGDESIAAIEPDRIISLGTSIWVEILSKKEISYWQKKITGLGQK